LEAIDVLIADDSNFIRKIISDLLLKNEGIDIVAQARDGKEAVKLAKLHQPDVILLDLLMPKMNGLDAFRLIMEDSPTPTIILSAVSPQNMDASIQALLMGAFDYVIKPGGLGSKDLPTFREELVAKVLLAAKSQIKKVLGKDKNDNERKVYLRQSNIDDAFKFGQYINQLKPIQEENSGETSTQIEALPKFSDIKKEIYTPVERIENTPEKIEKSKTGPVKKEPLKEITKARRIKEKVLPKKGLIKSTDKPKIVEKPKISKPIKKSYKPIQPLLAKKPFPLDLKPITKVFLRTNVVVIGASLGGPRTISLILKDLPANFSCPILVVQHLTEGFIETFVNLLNQACKINVKVAKNGEFLRPGVAYIAPGSQHMEISVNNNKPCIKIYKGTPVHFCMPSIDVLFFSAARVYKNKVLGVLLTGMGEDGVDGLGAIKKFKGKTIAESKETAVMYSMPKIAAERGVADKILPNFEINKDLIRYSK